MLRASALALLPGAIAMTATVALVALVAFPKRLVASTRLTVLLLWTLLLRLARSAENVS